MAAGVKPHLMATAKNTMPMAPPIQPTVMVQPRQLLLTAPKYGKTRMAIKKSGLPMVHTLNSMPMAQA